MRVCGACLVGAVLAVVLAGTVFVSTAFARPASAATGAVPTGGGMSECVAYAYAAIEARTAVPAHPPACAGLSGSQVNQAASTAIRRTVTTTGKVARRKQAIAAAYWTRAMITTPAPVAASPSAAKQPAVAVADPAADGNGRGLGGVSELAAKIGALLAWLATAASGAWIIVRWWLAGGSLRRKSPSAAPTGVTLGHAGGGILGLLLWAAFLATGWVALAWIALGLLAPVAGLGMCVLVLGLPRPVRAPLGSRRGRGGFPAALVAGHGLFVLVSLLFVLLATITAS
jgi:hypothetical protein